MNGGNFTSKELVIKLIPEDFRWVIIITGVCHYVDDTASMVLPRDHAASTKAS